MKLTLKSGAFWIILFLFSFGSFAQSHTVFAPGQSTKSSTILSDYVHSIDSTYRYELVKTVPGEKYDFLVLKMYSQHWLTAEIVNTTEWWHWISIVVPKGVKYETGMMWIGGGSTKSKFPESPDAIILAAATNTNSIVAQIHNVPFQPLIFANDSFGERREDEIITYGWRKFLEGGAKDEDAIWLARLPMTKAVKLAMDAVSDVIEKNYSQKLNTYVVGGASKRGWTTWTTAAVDKRVVAIIPVVIDMLNMEPSFVHHYKNYGFWAPAVEDYEREKIFDWAGTPEYDRLLEIVEPYSYRTRYDMPKLIINAAGDEFFQPDSWEFYWEDLIGEKHLQYVPNYGHNVGKSDAVPNLISFYASILNNSPRPEYKWEVLENHIKFQLDPTQKPSSVKLWTAYNEAARDFRIDVFGPKWEATEIPISENGLYEVPMTAPQKGFQGYFLEVSFPGKLPFKVTSGIEVLPRIYPFEEYVPERKVGSNE
jgi:PhoPQ-activated pathogenicity-related protein